MFELINGRGCFALPRPEKLSVCDLKTNACVQVIEGKCVIIKHTWENGCKRRQYKKMGWNACNWVWYPKISDFYLIYLCKATSESIDWKSVSGELREESLWWEAQSQFHPDFIKWLELMEKINHIMQRGVCRESREISSWSCRLLHQINPLSHKINCMRTTTPISSFCIELHSREMWRF